MNKLSLFLLMTAVYCSACSHKSTERYQIKEDLAPMQIPNIAQLENPQPKYEPYSAGGNSPYQVRGQDYQVMDSSKGYVEEGIASWYGAKFHGHQTSNGEIYDMFSLSAAHTRLPLPSFVEVTNLNNGKSVIVRVNDRGPFHSERVIDLSYAAASKLDMLGEGTAPVRLEAYHFDPPTSDSLKHSLHKLNYIQLAASSDHEKIQALANQLPDELAAKATIRQKDQIYKLQIGPIYSPKEQKQLEQALTHAGWDGYFQVSQSKIVNKD